MIYYEIMPLCPRCIRCHGLDYLTEDPLPNCPAFGGYEETECPECEGTGEQWSEAAPVMLPQPDGRVMR